MPTNPTITDVLTIIKYTGLKSPKFLTENLIKGQIALIQPRLKHILKKLGNKYVRNLIHTQNKSNQAKRMECGDD